MDTSCSEADDGSARLSLSLVSYGSDIEDADSLSGQVSETLVPALSEEVSQKKTCVQSTSSLEEEDLILSVAKQLGWSGVSLKKLDQLSSALDKMRASQQKFVKSKMLLDAVTLVAKSPTKLSAQTAKRVNQVLDHISLLDYVTPADVDSTEGLFGISLKHLEEHLPNELTAVDINQLREAVEKEIAVQHEKLVLRKERYTALMSEISSSNPGNCVEQGSTDELLSLRQEYDSLIAAKEDHLVELDKVASNITKLKLESLDRVYNDKVDAFGSRCELLKSHIQSVNSQIVKDTYLEDKHIINASIELKKYLDLAVTQLKSELHFLQKKDAEYEKLRGTHFDRLVKEYHDLKNQIAHKEYALKNLM